MRYVGSNELFIYLKCGKCKKVHEYNKDKIKRKNGTCAICKKPYRTIFLFPVNVKKLIPWIPPIIMMVFCILTIIILLFSCLSRHYFFNRIVADLSTLFISIFITVLGAIISIFPSLLGTKTSDKLMKNIPSFALLAESVLFVFILKSILTSNYNNLALPTQDSNVKQQYFGSVVGGSANGKGRLFDNEGNLIYYGGFSNDLYDGYGVKYEFTDAVHNSKASESYQCVYEGFFKDGLYNGEGREYRYDAEYRFEKEEKESSNLYYQGNFLNGKYCGYGTMYQVDKKYQGSFFNGLFNGYGNYWFIDSESSKVCRMEGCFKDNKMNGDGTKYYPSGKILFTGTYENGVGIEGSFYWENGNEKYVGKLDNDKRNGEGTSYREDHSKEYEGNWKDGQYSGYGTSYYDNGNMQYKGEWANGTPSGYGIWYWENENVYFKGNFNGFKPNGYGTTYSKDNTKFYTGNLLNGEYHGQGTSYWSNGKMQYDGNWENGQYSGYGIYYNSDETPKYEGNWEDGQYSGHGTEYDENGQVLHEGTFKDGQFISEDN